VGEAAIDFFIKLEEQCGTKVLASLKPSAASASGEPRKERGQVAKPNQTKPGVQEAWPMKGSTDEGIHSPRWA
jgi:hypothetical protein